MRVFDVFRRKPLVVPPGPAGWCEALSGRQRRRLAVKFDAAFWRILPITPSLLRDGKPLHGAELKAALRELSDLEGLTADLDEATRDLTGIRS